MDAEAKPTAHGLIQGYLGPDHKVRICRASIRGNQTLSSSADGTKQTCRGANFMSALTQSRHDTPTSSRFAVNLSFAKRGGGVGRHHLPLRAYQVEAPRRSTGGAIVAHRAPTKKGQRTY